MRSKLLNTFAAFILLTSAGISGVHAKLPPPTPEETAKAAAEAEKTKQQAAVEQAQLTKAQDQVAEKYRRDLIARGITPPAPTAVPPTQQANLPKAAVEPPGTAGPHGGKTQSAEAHSAPAK